MSDDADVGEGTPPIRVMLVDDQELVRSGLTRILRSRDGFAIVAECADGASVVGMVAAHAPDVVVMDLRMRDVGGIEATQRLQSRPAPPPVLVLTTFDDDELLSGALRAGAAGFVLKDAPAEDLIRAVRQVAGGGAWLDPTVTGRVLAAYRRSAPSPPPRIAHERLTPRELAVLELVGRGHTNAEVAAALRISELTVKSHLGRVLPKLGLRDRAAAIVYAFDHGIVGPA